MGNVGMENMLFYMIALVPAYLIIRLTILICRNTKINWYRETALLLFVLFAAGIVSQTVLPDPSDTATVHKTNLIPFYMIWTTYSKAMAGGTPQLFLSNFLGNILLFAPIGFFIPLLWKLSGKAVILIGFLSSLLIEICQLFQSRYSDIDDILLNVLGTALGLLLYRLVHFALRDITQKFQYKKP